MAASWMLAFLVALCLQQTVVFGQQGRSKCLAVSGTTSTNQIFEFTFKFDRQTATGINQIAFYGASPSATSTPIKTPAQCETSTLTNGIFQLGFEVNGDNVTLPCGISKSGNDYTINIAILDTAKSAFTFVCTTGPNGNLQHFPSYLNISNFETGNVVPRLSYRPNTEALHFQVMQAHGDKVPALNARLGRSLQLRVAYDKEAQANRGLRTIGTSFGVVFLQHNDADIYVEVMTPGLGAIVDVSGNLAGSVFKYRYPVKRDELTRIKIPDAYREYGTGNAWDTTQRTVRVDVVSRGTVVGVKSISIKRTGAPQPVGEYIAIPDHALGTRYNCYTGSDENDGLVLVYAVEDSTSLTVDFNAFAITGITINGNAVMATTSVSMNKNDVLKIECDNTCKLITLTSDRRVGVITGHEDDNILSGETTDHFVSQLPPVSTYGKEFVISVGFRYQISLEDPTASVTYTNGSAISTSSPSGTIIEVPTAHERITFNDNVLLLVLSRESTSGHRPFTYPLPAVHQWSLRQYNFAVPDVIYTYTIIARTGELSKIQYRSNEGVSTLSSISGFSATPAIGGSTYEFYEFTKTYTEHELIEFRSGSLHNPFLVLIKQTIGGNIARGSLPYGTLLTRINPCPANSTIVTSFGTHVQSDPGDTKDNDCDGMVDEERNNGLDDDGDNLIDEDLAPQAVPTSALEARTGVYVKTLKASDNAAFSINSDGLVYDLITSGCSSQSASSKLRIDPFTWNTNVGIDYDNYHVIDTPPFPAFYIRTPTVYFLVEIGFCIGNLTGSKCEDSCQSSSSRKRRQDEEVIRLEAEVEVTGTEDDGKSGNSANEKSCTMNKLYWIPPVLVLLTIFVEAVTIILLLLHRSALRKDV